MVVLVFCWMYENHTGKPKRGRPPKDPEELRNRRLTPIRATEEEEDLLKRGAKADGKGLSEWLRELGLKRARKVLGE